MIEKNGNKWTQNGKPVNSYELYAVYGNSIGKRPAQITETDVKNFLEWQRNPDRTKKALGCEARPTAQDGPHSTESR